MDTTNIPVTVNAFPQELQTVQSSGYKKIAILGTRHVSLTHQQLIEMPGTEPDPSSSPAIAIRTNGWRHSRTRYAQSAIDRLKNNAFDLIIEGESYRERLKPQKRREVDIDKR